MADFLEDFTTKLFRNLMGDTDAPDLGLSGFKQPPAAPVAPPPVPFKDTRRPPPLPLGAPGVSGIPPSPVPLNAEDINLQYQPGPGDPRPNDTQGDSGAFQNSFANDSSIRPPIPRPRPPLPPPNIESLSLQQPPTPAIEQPKPGGFMQDALGLNMPALRDSLAALNPEQANWRRALASLGSGISAGLKPGLSGGASFAAGFAGGLEGGEKFEQKQDEEKLKLIDLAHKAWQEGNLNLFKAAEYKLRELRRQDTVDHNKAMQERGNYEQRPGVGLDENGNVIDGRYIFNKRDGTETFRPGTLAGNKPTQGIYPPAQQGQGQQNAPLPSNPQPLVQPKTSPIQVNLEDEKGLPAAGAFAQDQYGFRNEDALEGMSEKDTREVRALAEGRQKWPARTARMSARDQFLLDKVREFDPNADETSYSRRQKTQNVFAGGSPEARSVAAMNTWAQHVDKYLKLTQEIDMGRFTTYNDAYIWMTQHGYTKKQAQDKLKDLAITSKAVADEGATVFAGTKSALADRNEWAKLFSLNTPASSAREGAKGTLDLVKGRLVALANQYNEGTRTTNDPQRFIAPKTREVFDRIEAMKDKYIPPSGSAEGKILAAPSASSSASGDRTKQAAPASPTRPANVPSGSAYNAFRKQWRSPDGSQIFDAEGNPVP